MKIKKWITIVALFAGLVSGAVADNAVEVGRFVMLNAGNLHTEKPEALSKLTTQEILESMGTFYVGDTRQGRVYRWGKSYKDAFGWSDYLWIPNPNADIGYGYQEPLNENGRFAFSTTAEGAFLMLDTVYGDYYISIEQTKSIDDLRTDEVVIEKHEDGMLTIARWKKLVDTFVVGAHMPAFAHGVGDGCTGTFAHGQAVSCGDEGTFSHGGGMLTLVRLRMGYRLLK